MRCLSSPTCLHPVEALIPQILVPPRGWGFERLCSLPCGEPSGLSCWGGRKFPTRSQPEEKQEILDVDTPWEEDKGEKKQTRPGEQSQAARIPSVTRLCLNPPHTPRPASVLSAPLSYGASTSSVTWPLAPEQQTTTHMHTGPARPPCGLCYPENAQGCWHRT